MPQTFFKGRDHILKPHKAYFNLILYCSFNLVALKMNNCTLEPFMSLWRLVPARHHNLVSFFFFFSIFLWKPVKHAVDMIPVKRALKTSSFTEAFFQHYRVDLCESGTLETFWDCSLVSNDFLDGCDISTGHVLTWQARLRDGELTLKTDSPQNTTHTYFLSHKLLHAAAVVCQKPYPATEHSSAAGSSPWAPGD